MSVTSLKRSGLKTGQKYNDAMAGNFKFAWLDTSSWTLMTRTAAAGAISASSNPGRLMVFNNKGEGMVAQGGPGSTATVTDFGNTVGSQNNIGYSDNRGSFNGWFLGSGNYITSNAGFKQNVGDGWTYITGYNNTTFSGGPGSGGFTSGGVPVWMIPVTTGSSPTATQGFLSTTTMPNTSWTLNTVGTINPSSSGSLARVALANDVVVYVHYSSNTTFNGSTLVIKYASVTPSTGAVSTTWNTGTLDFAATGMMLNLQTVGNVFVLTTTSGDRYSSTNGATWTRRATGTSGTTGNAMQITSGETGYMIGFGYNNTNAYGAQYSTDGITFTSMNTFSGTSYGNWGGIGVGKGIRFAQTDGGTVWFKQP